MGNHKLKQYNHTAADPVVVRVAVRPDSDPGVLATLRRGWRGEPELDPASGLHIAAVRVHPPTVERLMDPPASRPDDLALVDEPVLAAAAQQRAWEPLQHHA